MRLILLLTALLMYLSAQFNPIHSQETLPYKISGYLFGDYFYKVQGDSSGSTGEYSPYKKDYQAFDIRRVTFSYEHSLSYKFTAGISLEGGNKFLNSGRFTVILKTAFVEWKDIFEGSNLLVGYFATPAYVWGISEKMWGYRSVEKTISDFRGLTTGVDLGIGLRGSFDKKKDYGYFVMIGNGTGTKPENNKYKNYFASVNAKVIDYLNVEAFTEYEPAAEDKGKLTLKGIIAYQKPDFTIGTEVVSQVRKNSGLNNSDMSIFGISFYAHGTVIKDKINKIPKLNAFARFDMFDPDTKQELTGYKENFITAGLDYMPIPSVHFMPNIWINLYKDKSSANLKKDSDIAARLTFFYIYK